MGYTESLATLIEDNCELINITEDFDQYLDAVYGPVMVCGVAYRPSVVLTEMDHKRYSEMLMNYVAERLASKIWRKVGWKYYYESQAAIEEQAYVERIKYNEPLDFSEGSAKNEMP